VQREVSAELEAVDPATLPAPQRAEHARLRRVWREFRTFTELDALEVHQPATELFGRELSLEESIALIWRQYSPP
jgi:hypothetical protein